MRVLVTGASGFIGRHLVARLCQDGHTVTALVRPTSDTTAFRDAGVQRVLGDVTDPLTLAPAMAHQDAIVHLAAVVGKDPGGWDNHFAVGVQGTANVIDAAAAAGVSRFVALSSYAVYALHPDGIPLSEDFAMNLEPEPWNHYAHQKVLSEQLVWQAHAEGRLQATTIRPPTVVGPGDPNLVPVMQAIMSSPLGFFANDAANRVPLVLVEDLAQTLARAMLCDRSVGKAYNVAGREPITKQALLGLFREAGVQPLARHGLKRCALDALGATAAGGQLIARLVGHPGSPLLPRPAMRLLERYSKRRAQHDCVLDCSRAEADLGWEGAADYAVAVRRAVDWHRAYVTRV